MMSQPVCRFRLRFLGPAVRFSLLAAILLEVLIWQDGVRHHGAWLVARLLLLVWSALWVGLLVLLCRVRVTATGIKFPDWPLVVRELPWEQIVTVRRVNLLGFRFLAIYGAGKPFAMWLPLFLRDVDQFWQVVEGCVSSDHPLRASRTGRCT